MAAGTIREILEAIKDYGPLGLIFVCVAYVLSVSAKPFFQFLATDRENVRKHDRLMAKRHATIEAKNKTKQKGNKS